MKFYNYINEENIEFNNRDKKIIEYMEKCKPFLKDGKKCNIDDVFLYSGRKKLENYFLGKVRKNRRPLNTRIKVHEKLDKAFEEKFGVKARSESLFLTTDYSVARSYGNPYLIFPIGKYEIIGSIVIGDLFHKVGGIQDVSDEFAHGIVEKYQKGNLCKALNGDSEVMLVCDDYLAINVDTYIIFEGPEKLYAMIDQVI